MRRPRLPEFTAVAATASMIAGCSAGQESGNNASLPEWPTPAQEAIAETFAPRETAQRVGEFTLSCNVKTAKAQIWQHALNNTSFSANTSFSNGPNSMAPNRVTDGKYLIIQPGMIGCDVKIKAYFGLFHPERMRKDPSYDPVRIIDAGEDARHIEFVGLPSTSQYKHKTEFVTSTMRAEVRRSPESSPEVPLGFKSDYQTYGLTLTRREAQKFDQSQSAIDPSDVVG